MSVLARLLQEGKIKPIIDSAYPLSQVREAFRHMIEDEPVGKVVITPDRAETLDLGLWTLGFVTLDQRWRVGQAPDGGPEEWDSSDGSDSSDKSDRPARRIGRVGRKLRKLPFRKVQGGPSVRRGLGQVARKPPSERSEGAMPSDLSDESYKSHESDSWPPPSDPLSESPLPVAVGDSAAARPKWGSRNVRDKLSPDTLTSRPLAASRPFGSIERGPTASPRTKRVERKKTT